MYLSTLDNSEISLIVAPNRPSFAIRILMLTKHAICCTTLKTKILKFCIALKTNLSTTSKAASVY